MCLKVLRGEINRRDRDWDGVLRSTLKSEENLFKETINSREMQKLGKKSSHCIHYRSAMSQKCKH